MACQPHNHVPPLFFACGLELECEYELGVWLPLDFLCCLDGIAQPAGLTLAFQRGIWHLFAVLEILIFKL